MIILDLLSLRDFAYIRALTTLCASLHDSQFNFANWQYIYCAIPGKHSKLWEE
jgi:hypothetical protein